MIVNARIARTKDKPTSSLPHHFEKSAVFFERPATAGNAQETTNSAAVVMARGRAQGRCGPVIWGAAGELVAGSICSEGMEQYLDALCARERDGNWKIEIGSQKLEIRKMKQEVLRREEIHAPTGSW